MATHQINNFGEIIAILRNKEAAVEIHVSKEIFFYVEGGTLSMQLDERGFEFLWCALGASGINENTWHRHHLFIELIRQLVFHDCRSEAYQLFVATIKSIPFVQESLLTTARSDTDPLSFRFYESMDSFVKDYLPHSWKIHRLLKKMDIVQLIPLHRAYIRIRMWRWATIALAMVPILLVIWA